MKNNNLRSWKRDISTKQHLGWYAGGMCSAWIIGSGNVDYLHREISLEEYRNIINKLFR